MARSAPVPSIAPVPGMNPCTWIAGGGANSGGSGGGKGGNGNGGDGTEGGSDDGDPDGGGKDASECGQGALGSAGCPGPHGGNHGKTSAGEPVDIATGRVFTTPVMDLEVAGPIPLAVRRTYSSFSNHVDCGLGFGWSHSFAWWLHKKRRTIDVHRGDGTTVELPLPTAGNPSRMPGNFELHLESYGYAIRSLDGSTSLQRRFYAEHAVEDRWLLSGVVDKNKNEIGLAYGAGGRLAAIVDSVGRQCRVRWAGNHIAAFEVWDPEQSLWHCFRTYEHDERGDLIVALDGDGNPTRFEYDTDHRLLCMTKPEGMQVHYRYDRAGRCVETWVDYAGASDPALADSLPGGLTDRTPAKGMLHCKLEFHAADFIEVIDSQQIRRFEPNAAGQMSKSVTNSNVFSREFDEHGNLTRYVDPSEASWSFQYDDQGRKVMDTDPGRLSTRYQYGERGLLERVDYPSGAWKGYRYDSRGNIIEIQNQDGFVLGVKYEARGLPVEYCFPNGGVARCEYDALGNRVSVTEPNGARKEISYDYLGRPLGYRDAAGNHVAYAYDQRNNHIATRFPDGSVRYSEFDRDSRLCRSVDEVGRSTVYRYGGVDLICSVVLPDGSSMGKRYDREGRCVQIIDEIGRVHKIERDWAGLVWRESTIDGRRLRYKRDASGRVRELRSSGAVTVLATYNQLGRIVEREHSDAPTEAFSYDGFGRLTGLRCGEVELRYEYDLQGRIWRETQIVSGVEHAVTHVYDAMSRRVRLQTTLGRDDRLELDLVGKPHRLVLDGTTPINSEFDALGFEQSRLLPGGGRVLFSYQPSGDLTRVEVVKTGSRAAPGQPELVGVSDRSLDHSWQFSAAGDLMNETDSIVGNTHWESDARGRVTLRETDRGAREVYSFDATDNVLFANANTSYDWGNRIVYSGNFRYLYDGDSRLIEKREALPDGSTSSWRYSWESRGLLRHVELPDGTRVAFTYDSFARRMLKRVTPSGSPEPTIVTRFVWDEDRLLQEVETTLTSQTQTDYAYSQDSGEAIAQKVTLRLADGEVRSSGWQFLLVNPVDAPSWLITGDGQVITSVDRSAFGNVQQVPPDRATTRLRFRGQYQDSETGLVYNRFRYYDPQIGRYISPDPQGIWGGLNAFSYADNRPATAIDPDGLAPKKAVVTYNDGTPPDTSFSIGSPDHNATTPASVAKLNNLDNPGYQPSPKQPNYDPHKGQAPRHFHGPNDCAEVGALTEAANKGKLDKIDKIEVTGKNRNGDTIPAAPCVYCTQRLAEASVQSGVNLFDKVNPGTNKFATNPNDKEAAVIATSQGDSSNMPYEVDADGNIRNKHKDIMLPGSRGKKR